MKTALITGITGQAASYLSELLLDKGYTVWGLIRHSTAPILERTRYVSNAVHLIDGDLLDSSSLTRALRIAKPDEIYNLAAQSFVGSSWDIPEITCLTTGMGVLHLLEAVRKECPESRVWHSSSSEMFGNWMKNYGRFHEKDQFKPESPYAVAKVFAHHLCHIYRESHNLFVACSISFNFESERRSEQFVTRKISQAVARIKHGDERPLVLGNLQARRDWIHAMDAMRAAWLTLQAEKPTDYVIASGESHSVADFCNAAFAHVGLNWEEHVQTSPDFMRPSDVWYLCGDATKAQIFLKWEPAVTFREIVEEMVDHDMHVYKNQWGKNENHQALPNS